ncbi:M2 family metallopeptidase, partial [candidate division KSB1 bacterium]|nr:M2 family metallopeptidase [candidate division KSB1 bacterium]
MKKAGLLVLLIASVVMHCGQNPQERQVKELIQTHVETIKPLEKEASLAYWNAATTGDAADYERYGELDLQLRQVYSDTAVFAQIRELRESEAVTDRQLKRQLELLYQAFLENQIEPDLLKSIVELGAQVEQKFSTFRATLNGRSVTNNDILEVLKSETDSRLRRDAWMASKQVGPVVAADIIELVKLRNQAAQNLGFDSYHTLALTTSEQSVEELDSLFGELFELTREPYSRLKAELDSILAEMYGIGVAGLMPWHYHDPFFQETPLV